MVLRDNFYTVEHSEISEDRAGFRIKLNADNFVYKAHFQSNPITPGVCLIQMAVELSGVAKSAEFTVKTLKNVKFIAPVNPLEFPEVDFALEFVRNETGGCGGWQVKVLVSKNETVFAKISMLLI